MNPKTKLTAAKFLKFLKEEMQLKEPFKVKFISDRSTSEPLMKTYADYHPSSGDVRVYIKNRGAADVLRSIAHELVHHMQREQNKLSNNVQDVGGDIENEANAKAGELVKKFGYANPEIAIYDKLFMDLES